MYVCTPRPPVPVPFRLTLRFFYKLAALIAVLFLCLFLSDAVAPLRTVVSGSVSACLPGYM